MSSRSAAQLAVIATGLPRLALSRDEAAQSVGISLDSFERYVQPHVRMIRCGKLRLVPVTELQRWLDENAEGLLARAYDGDRQLNGRAARESPQPGTRRGNSRAAQD